MSTAVSPTRRRSTLLGWMIRLAIMAVGFVFLERSLSVALATALVIAPFLPLRSAWARFDTATAVGLLLGALIGFSDAEVGFDAFFALAIAGMVVAVSWAVRTCVRFVQGRDVKQPRPAPIWVERLAWAAVPVCGLLMVVLLATDNDLRLRLWLSQGALVDSIGSDPASFSYRAPRRIGLFDVRELERESGVTRWTTQTGFIFSRHGLAYAPEKRPTSTGAFTYEPLFGPWYTFTWSD